MPLVAGLLQGLVAEWEYEPSEATRLLLRFERAAPCIQEALRAWWATRKVNGEVCVAGYTMRRLVEEEGLAPITALLRLEELLGSAGAQTCQDCTRDCSRGGNP